MYQFITWAMTTPWALQPEKMTAFATILADNYQAKAEGHRAELNARASAKPAQRLGGTRAGSIAVIPIHGVIVQRASQLGPCEGGTSTEAIGRAIRTAQSDDTVGSILLSIDSPGGSCYGVMELAAEIRASAKPIVAIADSLAASAAYWIGSAASEFYVTPGGEVGSIGVWMAHEDLSQAMDKAGISVTLISAGKFKTEGHRFGPLGSDAKAFMQSRADDYYGAFTRDVARGRGVSVETVRGGMGQGRVLGAKQALAEKMVDGIKTEAEVIRYLQSGRPGSKGRTAALRAERELQALGIKTPSLTLARMELDLLAGR